MTETIVQKIAIIGVGLIGSSIARASAYIGAAETIALYDADDDARKRLATLELGLVAESAADACRDSDIVFICTPVGAVKAAVEACVEGLKPGAILTDVGSVKANVAKDLSTAPGHVHVIPGHPIAGTEQSGPDAGFARLFDGRWCVLTPLDNPGEGYDDAVEVLTAFWTRLGSRVTTMDVKRHDLVLAITSHVPHLIAYNIVATAADMEEVTRGEVVKFSAGGFRDFTRIAASDPVMWRDVFLNNKDAVLETLGRFSEDLAALQRAIRWEDGDALHDLFKRSRGIRQSIIDAGQDSAAPNFGRDAPPEDVD
ncbi:MAG: prephenate/arogenate dehydrogenase family protein [Pseudomonadota bacterium]